MVKHYLTLPGGLTACFKSACDLHGDADAQLYLRAHLPGAVLLDSPPPEKPDFTIHHEFSEKTRLVCKGDEVFFYTPSADEFSRDICHLLYAAERKELLKRELYPIHSACVGNEDGYVLLVGHSGAGKSTLAHKLVNEHGMKLFSGNKTVTTFDEETGRINAVAGTRTMTVLDESLRRHAYELENGQYEPAPTVNISAIHLIQVNDGVEETRKLARSTGIRDLHHFFMDAVNADVIVGDYHVFNGAVPSQVKHHLLRQLRQSLKSVPVYKSAGSMAFLSKQVLQK